MDADLNQDAAVGTVADAPLRQRVAQIRYDINWQGTAVRMQYERLVAHMSLPLEARVLRHLCGVADLDFLVISVHRLLHVAERARVFGCDTNGKLKLAIKVFRSQWLPQLIELRNALEHLDQGGAGVVPVQGDDTMSFIWRGGQMDVHKLFKAADELIRTICRVIEPLES